MVSRGAPDLDSLQVWDSEGLWESTAREINIGKHQRQAPWVLEVPKTRGYESRVSERHDRDLRRPPAARHVGLITPP